MAAHYRARTPDIECDGCANAIRASLGRLNGVVKVEVDVARKMVDVDYEPRELTETSIIDRLTGAGFPPERS